MSPRSSRRARRLVTLLAILSAAPGADALASCGAESCALDNSALGGRARRVSFELSFQHVDQDRVRVGAREGDRREVLRAGGELRTASRISTARMYGSIGSRWLVSVSLPYVYRVHEHVTVEGLPEPERREWRYGGLGDATALATWTALGGAPDAATRVALQAGVKLPTGRRHVPAIEGEEPEPHARPGTGSTDLLAGAQAIHTLSLPTPAGAAAPAPVFLSALHTHTGHGTGDYRVGSSTEVHVGLAYPLAERIRLLAQFNARVRARDHVEHDEGPPPDHDHLVLGLAAASEEHGPHENTGGAAVFATPGLRVEASPWLAFSGYLQIPMYQRVNGTQVVSRAQFWVGANYRLP